jgi:hypothetical protein
LLKAYIGKLIPHYGKLRKFIPILGFQKFLADKYSKELSSLLLGIEIDDQ